MYLLHQTFFVFEVTIAIRHLFFRDRSQRNLIFARIYKLLSSQPYILLAAISFHPVRQYHAVETYIQKRIMFRIARVASMSSLTPIRYCAVGKVCVLSSITGLRSPVVRKRRERPCRPTRASSDISTRRYDLSVNRVPSSRNKTPIVPGRAPGVKSLQLASRVISIFLHGTSIAQ